MRIRSRVRKLFLWGALLILAILAGGLCLAYMYVTDGTTVGALIEAEIPRYLPGLRLKLGRGKVRALVGEINLTHASLEQKIDGMPFEAATIPGLRVRHEARAMLRGEFVPREVVVSYPTLRLRRRNDGTWNLQGLLADPWPGPFMETPP